MSWHRTSSSCRLHSPRGENSHLEVAEYSQEVIATSLRPKHDLTDRRRQKVLAGGHGRRDDTVPEWSVQDLAAIYDGNTRDIGTSMRLAFRNSPFKVIAEVLAI